MASLTAGAQNAVLDALIRGVPLVIPPVWYVALVTTMGATNALAGVEVVGGAYARSPVSSGLAAWSGTQGPGSTGLSTGTGGVSSNNLLIQFPTPAANWGSVVGYEFWDQAINGKRWLYDTLDVPKAVSAGDPAPTFPIGAFAIGFS